MDERSGGIPSGEFVGAAFFEREAKLVQDFGFGSTASFEPGNGWAVDPETGKATYDPKEFIEAGYTQTQALFSTLHEVDHVKEARAARKTEAGKKIWDERMQKEKTERRYQVLDNCVYDVGDNRRVLQFAPALAEETERLYAEKLFKDPDQRHLPRHLQFATAILRQSMLPNSPTIVAPEVDAALQELRVVKGKKGSYDVIAIVTDPNCDPVKKVRLMEKYVDVVYERLFEQDKSDKKQQGAGSENNPETSFAKNYDDFNKLKPAGFSNEQIDTASQPEFGQNTARREKAGYEAENKVKIKDIEDYKKEYQKIERFLEPMRGQFRRIVAERLIHKIHFVSGKEEGVMFTPGMVTIAAEAIKHGQSQGPFFSDLEGRATTEEVPSAFEITGVFDRSGSMAYPNEKAEEQRRAAILLMESLQEFMEQPEVRKKNLDPDMYASCEIRSFGGDKENVIIRPFSPELTEQQRVEVYKVLGTCPGSATEDYIVLKQIIDEMTARNQSEPEYLDKVKLHKIKKIVAVFSDGGSSNQKLFEERMAILANMGVAVVQYRKIDGIAEFVPKMADLLQASLDDLCYKKERVK